MDRIELFPLYNTSDFRGEPAGHKIRQIAGETGTLVFAGPSGGGKSTLSSQVGGEFEPVRYADNLKELEGELGDFSRTLWKTTEYEMLNKKIIEKTARAERTLPAGRQIREELLGLKLRDGTDRVLTAIRWILDGDRRKNPRRKRFFPRYSFLVEVMGDPANALVAGYTRDEIMLQNAEGKFMIPDEEVIDHLHENSHLTIMGVRNNAQGGQAVRRYFENYVASRTRTEQINQLLDVTATTWIVQNSFRIPDIYIPPIVEERRIGMGLPNFILDPNSATLEKYRNRTVFLKYHIMEEELGTSDDNSILIHNPLDPDREVILDLRSQMELSGDEIDRAA